MVIFRLQSYAMRLVDGFLGFPMQRVSPTPFLRVSVFQRGVSFEPLKDVGEILIEIHLLRKIKNDEGHSVRNLFLMFIFSIK